MDVIFETLIEVTATKYNGTNGAHTFQHVAEPKGAATISWQRCASVCR